MGHKENILSLLQSKGPCVPSDLSRELGLSTLMVSSIFSELSSEKKILITSLKFGSSPFYYLPSQSNMLEGLSKHLNEKDRRAFELLKNERVVRGSDLDPLMRVSLQAIRDFAVPMKVQFKGEPETFWRYYKESQDSAVEILKKRYFPKAEKPVQQTLRKEVAMADTEDIFKLVESKFREMHIRIVSSKVIRKNKEADMDIKVQSPIGELDYYCKVKFKKRINDGDLSSAYISGESRNLPVLFVTDGKLTKRAEEISRTKFKNNFKVLVV